MGVGGGRLGFERALCIATGVEATGYDSDTLGPVVREYLVCASILYNKTVLFDWTASSLKAKGYQQLQR